VPDLAAADLIVSFMRNNAMESGTLDRFHQDI
jgi:hypothetical protein